ncbi:ATP-binding protein [Cognaticolwellia mytili]|uniref:ATP-binding protein n=1 Tax=Cognaticolwellia mytili TaxID=1888913 RepID=UPI000A175C1B|nr:ATP-binding protein [Cognaticolwellia mytili]
MKFNQLFVKLAATDNSDYGYRIPFSCGLNIIRGDNSSGKSTFVNSLIYALGMEEIIGSKGSAALPYALKSRFDLNGVDKRIINSSVYLELENRDGRVITLKRVIKSDEADTKLIQIIEGAYLTDPSLTNLQSRYTFLHDAGSAQDEQRGFFAYLEKFLGLKLPSLSDNKGKETKLYLQAIFSALLVEQKRGWTDYIANIPYYGVSSMREKVASFLLDLDVFRNTKKLNELQSQRSKLTAEWSELITEIKLTVEGKYLSISGLSKAPSIDFDSKLVSISERKGIEIQPIKSIREELRKNMIEVIQNEKSQLSEEPLALIKNIELIQNRIDELLVMQSMCSSQIKINESQLGQYVESLKSIKKDLKANKLTEKLVKFGADESELDFAKGKCHTCMNPIDDILISPDSVAMPMSLQENITHLDNQNKMTKSLLDGLEKNIERDKGQLLTINREIIKFRKELISLKRDIKSTNTVKESDVRRKITLENRQAELSKLEEKVESILTILANLSVAYKELNGSILNLTKYSFTYEDRAKISKFSNEFKLLASNFGYRSAEINEIEIKAGTLLPYLQDLELREQLDTPSELKKKEGVKSTTDIKSDSSASDFVRLIWSYLIALYKTSASTGGNHPGLILFDEPAQHSMSTKSVNKMLEILSTTQGLQSIVAASFDENDENYATSVAGLNVNNFKLEYLPRKIITKISTNSVSRHQST